MRPPTHHSSTDFSSTDNESGETGADEYSEPDTEQDNSRPTRLYQEAALYGQVLRESTPQSTIDGKEAVNVFADLVGHDLDAPDQAKTGRFAQFVVNDWSGNAERAESPPSTLSEEPEEADITPESSVTSEERVEALEKSDQEVSEAETLVAVPEEGQAAGDGLVKLLPEAIVDLLVQEFGPLASDEEEEQFLLEADAALFKNVAILGVLHLTTHRLTFHASLLATRPDILHDRQVIKSGTVTVHRPGLHRKRRIWLELSHDMLTTYPSSKFEDRIRPIKSILLSNIEELCQEDPEHPTIMRFKARNSKGVHINYAEVGTEEAAREWRKELTGALFMNRHRRASALGRESDDDANGVRISLPLHSIKDISSRTFLHFCSIFALDIDDNVTFSKPRRPGQEIISPSLPHVQCRDRVEIALIQSDEVLQRLPALVKEATARHVRNEDTDRPPSRVIVDFGSLSFIEQVEDPRKIENKKEEAIRIALSLKMDSNIWYARARLARAICSSGYFAVTDNYVGFWSKVVGLPDIRYRLSVSLIKEVIRLPSRRFAKTWTMTLEFQGYDSLTFDFWTEAIREEVIDKINRAIASKSLAASSSSNGLSTPASPGQFTESPPSTPAYNSGEISPFTAAEVLSPLSRTVTRAQTRTIPPGYYQLLPKVINIPRDLLHRIPNMHFVCLTIGSRGDVQPYIALGLGLQKQGHRVTIVTHEEYKDWIEKWGIAHRTAGGDPGALMKLSVEHKMFSPQFFKESLHNFRSWLDDLLVDSWQQCQDADVLLESPSAMAGVHIAEALGIPYFRTFTMPWTKTAEFPHSFLSPPVDSASFNTYSYILFDNVFWAATSGQINRWRRNTLHIGNTEMGHKAQLNIPFIYNFSTAVVPRPLDWADEITISGYWFLDNPEHDWTPPESLVDWMAKAKSDNKRIVYVGFGSITVPNPPVMTRNIIKAILKSDVRAIISKGWSSRMSKEDEPEIEFPPECYPLDNVPHDWLFPQIDAALHHGGAGTTGASLRAGIPTLIKPWFGDQYFWAARVHALGAGLKVSSLRSADLAAALTRATTDRIMKERAAEIGVRIREENGVNAAIAAISMYLPRAARSRTMD